MIHNFFFKSTHYCFINPYAAILQLTWLEFFLKYHVSQNRIIGITKKNLDNRGPDVVPDFQILL